jgi:hypothetical protein
MMHETVIPIYRIPIFFTNDINLLTKRVKDDIPDYEDEVYCHGRTSIWYDSRNSMHIGIYSDCIPTLAHESVHAAHDVFKEIGQKPDLDNDECYAYLVNWIVREFIDHIDI